MIFIVRWLHWLVPSKRKWQHMSICSHLCPGDPGPPGRFGSMFCSPLHAVCGLLLFHFLAQGLQSSKKHPLLKTHRFLQATATQVPLRVGYVFISILPRSSFGEYWKSRLSLQTTAFRDAANLGVKPVVVEWFSNLKYNFVMKDSHCAPRTSPGPTWIKGHHTSLSTCRASPCVLPLTLHGQASTRVL